MTRRFLLAHATHPQWQMACALVLAQLRASLAQPGYGEAPTLGLLYITDHYAQQAQDLLEHLSAELPGVTDWAGCVGLGLAATNVEYWDEPALAVLLCDVDAHQYRVFSGVAPLPLGFEARCALVHADGNTPDLAELIEELAERTSTGCLFGGVPSSRAQSVQFAVGGDGTISGQGASSGVFLGGLSGVAFGPGVGLVSRLSQGCWPIAPVHTVTAASRNLVLELDGRPALDVLLQDLRVALEQPQQLLAVLRATLVGLKTPAAVAGRDDAVVVHATGHFGSQVVVRHLVGLDGTQRGVALSTQVPLGTQLAFCERNAQTARADLVRMCAEVRDEVESHEQPQRMVGAVYVSCTGRGGPYFGGPSAELQIVRRALGDVPLVGFFAGGEIASNRLYGYTGVLTVFTAPA